MKIGSTPIADAVIDRPALDAAPAAAPRFREPERLSRRASLAIILGLSLAAWAVVAAAIVYLVG